MHPEPSGIPCWFILWDYILSSFPFCPPFYLIYVLGNNVGSLYKYFWFIWIWNLATSTIENFIYSETRGLPSKIPQVDYIFPPLQLHHHHHVPVPPNILFFYFFFSFSPLYLCFFFSFFLPWHSWPFIFYYFVLKFVFHFSGHFVLFCSSLRFQFHVMDLVRIIEG